MDDPHTLNALVGVTLGIGGVLAALVSGLLVIAWRISAGLTKRDIALKGLVGRVDEHEAECADRYSTISKQIETIDQRGAKMAQAISRIEGYIEGRER